MLPGNACIEGYPCSKHETAVTKMDTLKSDSQLQLMYIKSVMIYSSKYERRKKRSPGEIPGPLLIMTVLLLDIILFER